MYATDYQDAEPTRAEIDATPGPLVLEFGAPTCGLCSYAQPHIQRALGSGTAKHLTLEDGSGRPLGRSFQVRLWPTLVFLRDGIEAARVIRPRGAAEIEQALARIEAPSAGP